MALVTTAWSDAGDENAFVTRRVGAALAMEADVDVIVAEGDDDGTRGEPGAEHDGVFRVIRVPSHRPDRHRAMLLRSALCAGRGGAAGPGGPGGPGGSGIPDGVRAYLRRLGGASGAAPSLLRSLAPDSVVVTGHRHGLATAAVKQWSGCRRAVLLPLATSAAELELSLADGSFDGWDALLSTNRAEAELLQAAFAACPAESDRVVHHLRVALEPPLPTGFGQWSARIQVALPEDRRWLVVLDEPCSRPAQPPSQPGPEVEYLALRFPTLALVVVEPSQSSVVRGRSRRVLPELDRGTLWEVMAGAVATLDLRPPGALGREILESMLVSTPVLVPATSLSGRCHAESSNGGLWYRNAAELTACVTRMLDPETRDRLGRQARSWAGRAHGDQDAFVEAACASVRTAPRE